MPEICPSCHFVIADPLHYYFCPNCGKLLKEPSATLAKQLGVYALSIFLPPLGLWPGIKYLMSSDPTNKRVGIIAIILTVVASIVTIWLAMGLFNNINQSVSGQMQQYQSLTQ
jgi:uncharacterized membrane protein YqaE (UPF0057 family)